MFCVDSKRKQCLTTRVHTKYFSSFLKKISLLDCYLGLRGQFD